MLSWLGMRKSKKTGRQFFRNVQKRTVTFVLLTSLAALSGVKFLLTYLIPTSYLEDPIVAALPGVVGVLVAMVYVLVIERLFIDEADNTSR